MQTFLPYENFEKTAKCLDYKRLGKQRVESMQILNALTGKKDGWKNHPAVKMWRGYANALTLYMKAMIREWIARGYNNNMKFGNTGTIPVMPPWLGNIDFHTSHKSNLLRKDPDYYGQFGWRVANDIPYIWPIK